VLVFVVGVFFGCFFLVLGWLGLGWVGGFLVLGGGFFFFFFFFLWFFVGFCLCWVFFVCWFSTRNASPRTSESRPPSPPLGIPPTVRSPLGHLLCFHPCLPQPILRFDSPSIFPPILGHPWTWTSLPHQFFPEALTNKLTSAFPPFPWVSLKEKRSPLFLPPPSTRSSSRFPFFPYPLLPFFGLRPDKPRLSGPLIPTCGFSSLPRRAGWSSPPLRPFFLIEIPGRCSPLFVCFSPTFGPDFLTLSLASLLAKFQVVPSTPPFPSRFFTSSSFPNVPWAPRPHQDRPSWTPEFTPPLSSHNGRFFFPPRAWVKVNSLLFFSPSPSVVCPCPQGQTQIVDFSS